MKFAANCAACVVLLTSVSATAISAQEFEGPNGTKVTIYGQLNFGIQYLDDGEDDYTNFADSNVSTSRLGLNYDVPFGEDRLRFKFETSLGFPRSDNFSQTEDPDFDWERTNLRKIELIYSSDSFGTFSVGQGSMTTDGAAQEDVSGTSVVATPDPTDLAGNFEFRTNAGDLSGIEFDDAFADFDGPRRFRIRYDTPEIAGFTFGLAYGEEILDADDDDTYYDVALRYDMNTDMLEATGGIGYEWRDRDGGDTRERLVGSAGIKHMPTGLSLNGAFGDEDGGGTYGWLQFGWEGDLTSMGSTSFSLDYWYGEDFNVDGSESEAVTLAAVQKIEDYSLELYAAYRVYSYDDDADSYQDADLFFAGARWRF